MKILFVCTGNICRSPTAHAIARHKAKEQNLEDRFFFDSAGTNSYHSGESPDLRSQATGTKKGISFANITSRKIQPEDFHNFDLILAMTRNHYRHLLGLCEPEQAQKIKLFLQFCDVPNHWDDEVIDPYYGGTQGFVDVFNKIEEGVDNLLNYLKEQ